MDQGTVQIVLHINCPALMWLAFTYQCTFFRHIVIYSEKHILTVKSSLSYFLVYYLHFLQKIMSKNQVLKSFIGLGYYETLTPGVILRNVSKLNSTEKNDQWTKLIETALYLILLLSLNCLDSAPPLLNISPSHTHSHIHLMVIYYELMYL